MTHRIHPDWGIIAWIAAILTTMAIMIGIIAYTTTSTTSDCTDQGGHETLTALIPSAKGPLIPIYTCEGTR